MALSHNLPVGAVIKAFDKQYTLAHPPPRAFPDADRIWLVGGGWVYADEVQDVLSVPAVTTVTVTQPTVGVGTGPQKQSDEFNEDVLNLAVSWGREVVFQHKGKTRIVEPDAVYVSDKGNTLVGGEYEGEYRTFRIDKIENEVAIRPL